MILQMAISGTALMLPPAGARGKTGSDLRSCLAVTCGQTGGREKGKGSAASLAGPETSEEPRVPLELHALRDNYRREALPVCQRLPGKSAPRAGGRQRGQCGVRQQSRAAILTGAGESVQRQCRGARSLERAEGRSRVKARHGRTAPDIAVFRADNGGHAAGSSCLREWHSHEEGDGVHVPLEQG